MSYSKPNIRIDGKLVPFEPGQTVMEAAAEADVYIPHLCHHPDLPPHGSCKLCTVKINDAFFAASCSQKAEDGMEIDNGSDEIKTLRRSITGLLLVDGNHSCPSCRTQR